MSKMSTKVGDVCAINIKNPNFDTGNVTTTLLRVGGVGRLAALWILKKLGFLFLRCHSGSVILGTC